MVAVDVSPPISAAADPVSTAITVGGLLAVVVVVDARTVEVVVDVDVVVDWLIRVVSGRVLAAGTDEIGGAAIADCGIAVGDGVVGGTVVATRTSMTSAGPVVDVVDAGIVVVVVVVVGRTMSATFAVAELRIATVPFAFVAVTSNLRYLSMSSSVSVYEVEVAPVMFTYEPAAVEARFHLYV